MMPNNESSHLYSQNQSNFLTNSRSITGVNSNQNSNESFLSLNDGFVIDTIAFIQGYQTECFQFVNFDDFDSRNKNSSRSAVNYETILNRTDISTMKKNNGNSLKKLGKLTNFHDIIINVNDEVMSSLSHSCKDLLSRFFVPLAKMVRFLQLVCESIIVVGPHVLGQSIVDYCQKEIKNIILVNYCDHLNAASTLILDIQQNSNSMALVSIMNGLTNLEEYFMITDAVKVFEEYITKLNEKLSIDKDVAEFQMFMKTLKENNVKLVKEGRNESDNIHKTKENDDWISYDTRLSETPQGSTVIALIWKHARVPFKKRNLQEFNKFSVNKNLANNDKYIPGNKVIERFIYLFNDWILNGNLVYPESDRSSQFDFFVTDVLGFNSKLRNERLWEIKFNILKDGLDDFIRFVQPCFSDKDLLKKVLVIGKLKHLHSIFNSQLYKETSLEDQFEYPVLDLETFENHAKFYSFINTHYTYCNKLVMEMFEKKYQANNIIPNLIWFYQCKATTKSNNLFQFLNNSLLDLTKYPTEFNLRSLQNKFQIFCQGIDEENENSWMDMVSLRFDDITLLDHINNFKTLQNESEVEHNSTRAKLDYDGNFQDFKKRILPTGIPLDSDNSLLISNNQFSKNNNKLVSINFIKMQLNVPFPLSIILNKTLAMQLEMVQRKLIQCYYMEKIMIDIHLEINKNYTWIVALKHPGLNVLGIKKLHYRMNFFIKSLTEYINNGVLLATKMPEIEKAVDLADFVFELNNYLTNIMIKCWLTNSDISACEHNVVQLIFQFCKFVTHLRIKLEAILYNIEDSKNNNQLIESIDTKLEKYERSFNEWLQLYIECVYAEFSRTIEGNGDNLSNGKGLNGIFLKKFLRDLESILSF
ncbi:hypothetical protein QEN19_002428 [Hanseniaspora menglaensis]